MAAPELRSRQTKSPHPFRPAKTRRSAVAGTPRHTVAGTKTQARPAAVRDNVPGTPRRTRRTAIRGQFQDLRPPAGRYRPPGQLHRHGRYRRGLPVLGLLRGGARRNRLRYRRGLFAARHGGDGDPGSRHAATQRHRRSPHRKQQRRPRIRPRSSETMPRSTGRVVSPESQQGSPHPVERPGRTEPHCDAGRMADPLARPVRRPGHLPAAVPRKPARRRAGRADRHHRDGKRNRFAKKYPGRRIQPVTTGGSARPPAVMRHRIAAAAASHVP